MVSNVKSLSSSIFLQIMKQERWKEVTFELPKYSRISQYPKFACSSTKFISILLITPFKLKGKKGPNRCSFQTGHMSVKSVRIGHNILNFYYQRFSKAVLACRDQQISIRNYFQFILLSTTRTTNNTVSLKFKLYVSDRKI